MSDLHQRSIEVILEYQSDSGAYPASPNFPTYRYSWYRDGAFIAYSMNLSGEHASAARFHNWAADNINKRADIVKRAVNKAQQNIPLAPDDILHTRYSVDGNAADEDWPNFQLDGFGTWLWALGEHQRLSHMAFSGELLDAAQLVANYIAALWNRPCYDCWEEFPEQVHPYSIAAIYAGLLAHAKMNAADHQPILDNIRKFLGDYAVVNGHFAKYIGSSIVDASLLGLALPYGVFELNDPLIVATVAKIESTLRRGGGIHRYEEDSYYGGGEWVLLSAWLGWYYAEVGKSSEAETIKKWVEAQADNEGNLVEQIPASLNDESFYAPWRERWGDIAKPLLWSHAKYIILLNAIEKYKAC